LPRLPGRHLTLLVGLWRLQASVMAMRAGLLVGALLPVPDGADDCPCAPLGRHRRAHRRLGAVRRHRPILGLLMALNSRYGLLGAAYLPTAHHLLLAVLGYVSLLIWAYRTS
jgi:hypothetical protein